MEGSRRCFNKYIFPSKFKGVNVNMKYYREDRKTHDLSLVSKTVLTILYGFFSRTMVFLIFLAFLSRRYGAKADIAPVL